MAQPQRRPADDSMPPKLDDEIKRLNIIVPAAWARRVDDWRRHQDDLPNFSEAIRRLVAFGDSLGIPVKYVCLLD